MKQRGFTLVEVLVVVALIGVLAALGGGNYVKSISKGRDTKRAEDMNRIAYGFESYRTSYGQYDVCDVMLGKEEVFPAGPPEGTDNYPYGGVCSTTGFKYCAALENPENYGNATCGPEAEAKVADGKTDYNTCSFKKTGQTHYCVINVQ